MKNQRTSSGGSKFLLTSGLLAVTGAYALWHSVSASHSLAATTPPVPTQASSIQITSVTPTVVTAPPPAIPTPAPTPAPPSMPNMPMMHGLYANGSYTGVAADAYYGIVQVKAIIKNGQLADVQFLQYPNDRDTSRYINGQAMPMLTQEAIQVQSAQVDGVSGATATSGAFIQSLASALSQAKA